MCTLTFVPDRENPQDFLVTSNRDESPDRNTVPPKIYSEMNVEIWCPKDQVAGGTWIGASSKDRLVCLLNGGFGRHKRKKSYRMSRGLVVKKLLLAEKTTGFIDDFNFVDIEPFTMVIVDWFSTLALRQLIWDGTKKHLYELPVQPYIWSAPMLYSQETKQKREIKFQKFLTEHPNGLTREMMLGFHKQFRIDRKVVKTTSITQFALKSGKPQTNYFSMNQ